jgi:hypothetical protein
MTTAPEPAGPEEDRAGTAPAKRRSAAGPPAAGGSKGESGAKGDAGAKAASKKAAKGAAKEAVKDPDKEAAKGKAKDGQDQAGAAKAGKGPAKDVAPSKRPKAPKAPGKRPKDAKAPGKAAKPKRKRGGQKGHRGTTLTRVADPDQVIELKVDRAALGPGDWTPAAPVVRQVIDLKDGTRHVVSYVAEVLIAGDGRKAAAELPDSLGVAVQYGPGVEAMGVYLACARLLSFQLAAKVFESRFGVDISEGTLANFRREAAWRLKRLRFRKWAASKLRRSRMLHLDVAEVDIDGAPKWYHGVSGDGAFMGLVHDDRGVEALKAMGVLPAAAPLHHDHWTPYLEFGQVPHSTCNAQVLMDLKKLADDHGLRWAGLMGEFLVDLAREVDEAQGRLGPDRQLEARERYRSILGEAEKEHRKLEGGKHPRKPKPPADGGRVQEPGPAKPKAAKPEPGKPKAAKPEPVKPGPAKPKAAKPEPAKPGPAKPKAAMPEPKKPKGAKPEPLKPKPEKPKPAKPKS